MVFFILALGGASGAVCRYLLGKAVDACFPKPSFPLSMLFVNLIGSFGLGVFLNINFDGVLPQYLYNDSWFLFLGVGFFGAFTTYSTFSLEAYQLLEKKCYLAFIYYTTLSLIGSFLLFGLGYWMI
ncbi:fluoride efflux transporter CrcB [Alteribacillus iranensis]|uniref:Fluoride-specific ion channel FluC n=1 Tax=Alteribacillus iranensis TaxID=930128 RepID=A0A1I2EWX6_9BACI|nr:fluoride efflux transporter CrcB [Alteribacillus iranensis]SFE97365.1 camphor resistance protein CrcB [Alteribacillus iranensis]